MLHIVKKITLIRAVLCCSRYRSARWVVKHISEWIVVESHDSTYRLSSCGRRSSQTIRPTAQVHRTLPTVCSKLLRRDHD